MKSTDRRGILWYVALSFGLTWAADFAMLAAGVRFDKMPTWAFITVALTMTFPALAAWIVRKFIAREGFGSAGLRLGPWKPYLAVWLGVPVLFGVSFGLSSLLGFAQFDPSMQAAMAQLAALTAGTGQALPSAQVYAGAILFATFTIGLLITSVFTFGEEFGWTGYLLPKLLPLGKWRATVIYGVIWGLWHAPIIWGGYNYPGYPLIGILMMCVACTVLGLWQTALRLRTGSVLLTTWFHGVINSQSRGIWALLFVNVHPLLGGVLGLVGLLVLGGVGAWLVHRSPDQEPQTR